MGITGDSRGVVIFSFPPEVAMMVASRLMESMGVPPPTTLNEEATSALAELMNMVTQGFKVEISVPTVLKANKVNFALAGLKKILAVPLVLPTGPGEIIIAIE